jgi:hypothetical protein
MQHLRRSSRSLSRGGEASSGSGNKQLLSQLCPMVMKFTVKMEVVTSRIWDLQ